MEPGETNPQGPWAILGLDVGATDQQIRDAYVEGIRRHPPDRDPRRFEQIRDAYEELRDPRRRAMKAMLSVDPYQPLESLLGERPVRRRVGAAPWLAAMK